MTDIKGNGRSMLKKELNPRHFRDFTAITSGMYQNIALVSCNLKYTGSDLSEPTSIMVTVNQNAKGDLLLAPMFVAVTPGMILTDDNGNRPENCRGEFYNPEVRALAQQALDKADSDITAVLNEMVEICRSNMKKYPDFSDHWQKAAIALQNAVVAVP